ncbi:hypothetical protein SAY87_021068 [Trapa incisa]|uniref:Pentatricopeptide repeat-containing protein n=1 Tax=Trapa incisa TaxID=236973 RepID=A0AAN7PVB2_9MYRT|nr:hypothetical protein SAY87_021068 [Trapa incisa]
MGIEIWDYMVENHFSHSGASANVLLLGLCNLERLSEVRKFLEDMFNKRIIVYESTMEKIKDSFCRKGRSSRETYELMLIPSYSDDNVFSIDLALVSEFDY